MYAHFELVHLPLQAFPFIKHADSSWAKASCDAFSKQASKRRCYRYDMRLFKADSLALGCVFAFVAQGC